MENTKYGKRREGQWTPIRANAQDTRVNPNGWETHLVRKRWDIGLLRALSPRINMMNIIDARHSVFSARTAYARVGRVNHNIRLASMNIPAIDLAHIRPNTPSVFRSFVHVNVYSI